MTDNETDRQGWMHEALYMSPDTMYVPRGEVTGSKSFAATDYQAIHVRWFDCPAMGELGLSISGLASRQEVRAVYRRAFCWSFRYAKFKLYSRYTTRTGWVRE